MYKKPDMSIYKGRVDAEKDSQRWHEKIQPLAYPYNASQGIAFLGFCCDEGVKRNGGRIGAKKAPKVLKAALSNFAYHDALQLYDAGDLICETNLEAAQKTLALHVKTLLQKQHFPIVLGGGHEVAYGSYKGMRGYFGAEKSIGIINFDAHFDLRRSETANSGTPFLQIAEDSKDFKYLCLGISKASNTKSLFDLAKELNVDYILDVAMHFYNIQNIFDKIENFMAEVSILYITVDSDVFAPYIVPSTSAMSGRGIEPGLVYLLLEKIFQSKKVKLVDIAEFSPKYDIEHIGEKVISRLVFDIVSLCRF